MTSLELEKILVITVYRVYVPDVIAAMLVFRNERILIFLFCLVHQYGCYALCYSSLWGLSESALQKEYNGFPVSTDYLTDYMIPLCQDEFGVSTSTQR